jgi:predicted flap endonuclease-1-like 5' DNA nuclease
MLDMTKTYTAGLLPLLFLQASGGASIPWYIWLVIILVVLLILFIAFVGGPKPGPSMPEGGVQPEPMAEQPAARMETPAPELEEAEMPQVVEERPPDDLKRIEGIGPKVSALLNEHGIYTFQDLAEAGLERLNEILDQASLQMLEPSTWSEQATLAAAGRWEEFETLQDELKGGRRA